MSRLAVEPFAVELFRRFRLGSTISDLARETGIPQNRIEMRLRAACGYLSGSSADRRSSTSANFNSQERAGFCCERRQLRRFPVKLAIKYKPLKSGKGEVEAVGLVRDLSRSVISFDAAHPLQRGDRVGISLGWPEPKNGAPYARWTIDGAVIRTDGNSVAVKISGCKLSFERPGTASDEERRSSRQPRHAPPVLKET